MNSAKALLVLSLLALLLCCASAHKKCEETEAAETTSAVSEAASTTTHATTTTATVQQETTVQPAGETEPSDTQDGGGNWEQPGPPDETIVAAATAYPQLGFDIAPTYMNKKEVVLTFDDLPGWQPATTLKVLDTLKTFGKKASFFVNSMQDVATNWANADVQNCIKRILSEGHRLASHTRSHPHLQTLATAAMTTEINGVEADLRANLPGVTIPQITLFRAPYGEPFQWKWYNEIDDATYDRVASVVAQKFVHIGWNLDSNDWQCASSGSCMSNNVINLLKAGGYGVILMHSTNAATADGLAAVLTYLNSNGYSVVDLETVVARVYGTNSLGVVNKVATTRAAATTTRATTMATTRATTKPSVGVTSPSATSACTGNLCQTTSIVKGGKKFHPTPTGYYCTTGTASVTHRAILKSSTPGSDLDLYFQKWNAALAAWTVVGSSLTTGSNEQYTASAGPGCYTWQVYSFANDATYTLDMRIPEYSAGTTTKAAATTTVRTTTKAAATTVRTTTRAATTTIKATTKASTGGTCQVGSPECNCDAAIAAVGIVVRDGDGCLMNEACQINSCQYFHNDNIYCCAQGSSSCNVTTNEDDITTCECGYTGDAVPGDTYRRRSAHFEARRLRAMKQVSLRELELQQALRADTPQQQQV